MASSDEARMTRKKQNRQAQIVYRERKRAAEIAQKQRVTRLENVVEEMSSVFMEFADNLMNHDAVKKDRSLMTGLGSTIEVMLSLAAEVVGPDEAQVSVHEKQSAPEPQLRKQSESRSSRESSKAMVPSSKKRRLTEPNKLEQPAIMQADDFASQVQPIFTDQYLSTFINGASSIFSGKLPPQVFGNGWMPSHGDFDHLHPEFDDTTFVPYDTFSYQLTESALITSYNHLLEDVYSTGRGKDIMQLTQHHKGREPHIAYIRWMLSLGRHTVYRAIDFPAGRFARWLMESPASAVRCGAEPPPEFPDDPSSPYTKFLSAMEVQKKLEDLGAREMDKDTVELTIPAGSMLQDDMSWQGFQKYDIDGYEGGFRDTAMKVRLSTSLLISNLSQHPVCVHAGPGYATQSLYKAVEASLISVPTNDVWI